VTVPMLVPISPPTTGTAQLTLPVGVAVADCIGLGAPNNPPVGCTGTVTLPDAKLC